ncbi:MAG: hypothetical protein HZB85_01165, partial [Deltaproteobacteria bacterium]|nr:hypothetical protein [Deltaproteobacteria bacterium]
MFKARPCMGFRRRKNPAVTMHRAQADVMREPREYPQDEAVDAAAGRDMEETGLHSPVIVIDESTGAEGAGDEAQEYAVSAVNDPVKAYLREMGAVYLLNREEEVALAKRIEDGREAVVAALVRTPLLAAALNEIRERLVRETAIVSDADDEADPGVDVIVEEEPSAFRTRIDSALDLIKGLSKARRGRKPDPPGEPLVALLIEIDKETGLFEQVTKTLIEAGLESARL